VTKYTPLQTLAKCHRELWWTIRLLGSAQAQLDYNSDCRIDTGEVEKVLRAMTIELGRIIRAEESKVTNQRNVRQGSDLALKAQLAKARSAVAEALEVVPDGQSHK
jgi:hypothetical protein